MIASTVVLVPEETARRHYAAHQGQPFFEPAVKFLASAPSLVMIWEADGIISMVRKMVGDTLGYDAEPGTIRGDLGCSTRYNLVHGSDGPESAQREIDLFFTSDEIIDYEFSDARWLYT